MNQIVVQITTNYSIKDSKSVDYKASITGKLEGNNTEKESEIVLPLKYLSNFWRILDIPLINSKINLILTWSEICVLTSKATRDADPKADPAVVAINDPTNATFKITDVKLYVPVVTLSTENDKTLLEQLRTGFKRTIKWNKYRSEMTNQTKNNNLNYLIDPTFTKVNRLFVLSFKNEDFNMLIDGKSFFDMPIKNEEEAYEQIIEMGRGNDYTASNLLDYEYFSKHYKLITIDLNKQIELENPDLKQEINFIGRLEDDKAAMFFIIEKSEKTTFTFSLDGAIII